MVDTSGLPFGKPVKREKPERKKKARKPINRRNEKRLKKRRDETHGPQHFACFEIECFACGREGASVGHEEPPRSRGGTDKDALALCDLTRLYGQPGCHQNRHTWGEKTFWRRVGKDPEEGKLRVQAYIAAKARGEALMSKSEEARCREVADALDRAEERRKARRLAAKRTCFGLWRSLPTQRLALPTLRKGVVTP